MAAQSQLIGRDSNPLTLACRTIAWNPKLPITVFHNFILQGKTQTCRLLKQSKDWRDGFSLPMVKVNVQLQWKPSLSLGGICIQNFKVISMTSHQQLQLQNTRCHYIALVLRKSLLAMLALLSPESRFGKLRWYLQRYNDQRTFDTNSIDRVECLRV